MADYRPLNATSALEQARAQLEIVLREEAHWRTLVQATLPANRAALERALAGNPVYRAWELLGRAIGEMRAGEAVGGDDAAPETAPPQAPARRPRVELRDVLERIRGEASFDTVVPPTAAATADDDPGAAPAAGPAIAPADIEIEEATVSFIVRKPAAPGRQPSPPQEPPADQAIEPHGADTRGAAAGRGDEDGTETEVRIVPRRS